MNCMIQEFMPGLDWSSLGWSLTQESKLKRYSNNQHIPLPPLPSLKSKLIPKVAGVFKEVGLNEVISFVHFELHYFQKPLWNKKTNKTKMNLVSKAIKGRE